MVMPQPRPPGHMKDDAGEVASHHAGGSHPRLEHLWKTLHACRFNKPHELRYVSNWLISKVNITY